MTVATVAAPNTQAFEVGERVFFRRRRAEGTVREARWINPDAGWCYLVGLLGYDVMTGSLHLERITVRVGDFIEGHRIFMGTRHRGRVTEILPGPPFPPRGHVYRLDLTGETYWGGGAIDPIVTFDQFVYPRGGE
jgi:hypothetical protein